MQWGPDADAKLFMHVLKIHNVQLDYKALALAMGNDVTPKAITHRIAKLRSMADETTTGLAPLIPPKRRSRSGPTKTGANTTAIGTKRTASGTLKAGSVGSPLKDVISADEADLDDVGMKTGYKKVKRNDDGQLDGVGDGGDGDGAEFAIYGDEPDWHA